jgi:hypothetical protein
MTLYSPGLVFSSMLQSLAAAGAPGAMVRGPAGDRFNPVHELVRGFSQAFVVSTTAATASSLWYSVPPTPPLPTSDATPSSEATGAPASVGILPNVVPALAASHASTLGWTGTHAASLFRGAYSGLISATSSSGKFLRPVPGSVALPVTGQLVQLHMSPLDVPSLASAMVQNWLNNPLLGAQGDPSRRIALATEWAKVANTCWINIRPFVQLVGTPTGTYVGTHTLSVV